MWEKNQSRWWWDNRSRPAIKCRHTGSAVGFWSIKKTSDLMYRCMNRWQIITDQSEELSKHLYFCLTDSHSNAKESTGQATHPHIWKSNGLIASGSLNDIHDLVTVGTDTLCSQYRSTGDAIPTTLHSVLTHLEQQVHQRCSMLTSAQRLLQWITHEAVWTTSHSGLTYRALQLDIEFPRTRLYQLASERLRGESAWLCCLRSCILDGGLKSKQCTLKKIWDVYLRGRKYVEHACQAS